MGISTIDDSAANGKSAVGIESKPLSKKHIVQPYKEANPFTSTRSETPETISRPFKWARHLIEPDNISDKYEAFASSAKFPLDGKELTNICQDSFAFCGSIYNDILFPKGSPQLPYHNLDHGLITSITAQKIFLGGLVKEAANGKVVLPPKEKIEQLHSLFSLVSSFHEIDDWWKLPYPGNKGDNPYINEARIAITDKLTKMGISTHDFNRLLVLDDFRESQESCIDKSLALKTGYGFLGDNKQVSLLDGFSLEDRTQILTLASKGLCAADFLQVINPAYIQPTTMTVRDNLSLEGHAGPYALAAEMSKWRKNALKPPGWGDPSDGTIYWDKVKLTTGFFEGVALPRIYSGLDYLDVSVPDEYKNAKSVIANKLTLLHDAIEESRMDEAKKKLSTLTIQ